MEAGKFELGQVVETIRIAIKETMDYDFFKFTRKSLERYKNADWGDTCEEDKKQNDEAVKNGERILAVYKYNAEKSIWIITEWDRSVTTILFLEEY